MINKSVFLAILADITFTLTLTAQKGASTETQYCRSSLCTILVESDVFPKKNVVMSAYYDAPFPDKYNNQAIGTKSFNPKKYALTDKERDSLNIKKGTVGKFAKSFISSTKLDLNEANNKEIPYIIRKYFIKNKIANQLVAKWFNRKEDGSFDMNLIAKRGYYNATELEATIAKNSVRGRAILADAGEKLLKNTFVVINKMNFVKNEVPAATAREIAYKGADQISNPIARFAAKKAADILYNKSKDGYSVWTTSYLYQLEWNDSIAAVFYNNYWFDKTKVDSLKKEKFNNGQLFKLKYIGSAHARSVVLFTSNKSRKNKPSKTTEEQIIKLATIRNIDKVYAKLQQKFDVFKTVTPLYSGTPITAKIGMKEGLNGGEKFEVLEKKIDPKTGLSKYVRKGIITVKKNSIWDNRYNMGEKQPDKNRNINITTFKGKSGKYYAGMLIKQIK